MARNLKKNVIVRTFCYIAHFVGTLSITLIMYFHIHKKGTDTRTRNIQHPRDT